MAIEPRSVIRGRVMEVEVYSRGIVHCSVCAPPEMSGDEVASHVEYATPAGTDLGWQVSKDATFSDGVTLNGGIVECHNGKTRHWLLDC